MLARLTGQRRLAMGYVRSRLSTDVTEREPRTRADRGVPTKIHYCTPEHANWLKMADRELSVF